jgi:hypothetical protein
VSRGQRGRKVSMIGNEIKHYVIQVHVPVVEDPYACHTIIHYMETSVHVTYEIGHSPKEAIGRFIERQPMVYRKNQNQLS